MDAVIFKEQNKKNKTLNTDDNTKFIELLSMLSKNGINKVYVDFKVNKMNQTQNNKLEIVPIKFDGSIKDLSVLSKMNYLVNEEKIKNDLIIIVGNAELNSDFSNMLDYFEATKKPIILLKTAYKNIISKNNEVILDKNGIVKTIVEHPINPKSKLTSAGVYFMPKDALFWIKKIANTGANKTSFDFFIKRLSQKRKVRGIINKQN